MKLHAFEVVFFAPQKKTEGVMVEFSESGAAHSTVQLCQYLSFRRSDFTKVLNETLDNALEALKSAKEQPIMEFLIPGSSSKSIVHFLIFLDFKKINEPKSIYVVEIMSTAH